MKHIVTSFTAFLYPSIYFDNFFQKKKKANVEKLKIICMKYFRCVFLHIYKLL